MGLFTHISIWFRRVSIHQHTDPLVLLECQTLPPTPTELWPRWVDQRCWLLMQPSDNSLARVCASNLFVFAVHSLPKIRRSSWRARHSGPVMIGRLIASVYLHQLPRAGNVQGKQKARMFALSEWICSGNNWTRCGNGLIRREQKNG